jgi:hypothetical protein
LWHTDSKVRVEGNEGYAPEIHIYKGAGLNTELNSVGVSASVSFVWAYAEKLNRITGQMEKASNSFIANGVNWTGNFNTVSLSFTAMPKVIYGIGDVNIVASHFNGVALNASNTELAQEHWQGYSIGAGVGVSANPLNAKGIGDVISLLGKASGAAHQQYFYLLYGNGGDKLKNGKDVSGFHFLNPIDPQDNH